MTAEQDERRRFHRFPFDADCVIELDDGAEERCDLLDLSINGALVALAPGESVEDGRHGDLTLKIRGRHDRQAFEIVLRVRAVRIQDDRVACRFVGADPDSFEQLRDLIAANLGDTELLDRELTQLDYWPGLSVAPAD